MYCGRIAAATTERSLRVAATRRRQFVWRRFVMGGVCSVACSDSFDARRGDLFCFSYANDRCLSKELFSSHEVAGESER